MSLVVLQVTRQEFLVANQDIINEWNTSNPVTMFDFSIALNIILTTGKVPHEITPVHEVYLIGKEELDVFPLGRDCNHQHFSALVIGYLTSFDATQPVFIKVGCASTYGIIGMLFTIHSWEQHVLCIFIFGFVTNHFVAVLFIGRFFFLTLIDGSTFYYIVYTSAIYFFQCRFRCVSLSVEQRAGSVLLTTEIFT